MVIPETFSRLKYNSTSENFNNSIKTINEIWGLDNIINSVDQTTLSSWKLDIEEEFGETSFSNTIIEKFEGLLYFDSKLNRLVVFRFDKKFIYRDIEKNTFDGLSEIFYNRSEKIFNISKKNINKNLTRTIVICEEVSGTEYFKYLQDLESSYFMDLYKIIPIGNNQSVLEHLPLQFKYEKYTNSYFTAHQFFKKYYFRNKTQYIFNLTIESLKHRIPGEMDIKLQIDTLLVKQTIKALRQYGINEIANNNNILYFSPDEEQTNESDLLFIFSNGNNEGFKWSFGDANIDSIKDLKTLLRTFNRYIPSSICPDFNDFLIFKIEIDTRSPFQLSNQKNILFDNPVVLKIRFGLNKVIIQFKEIDILLDENLNSIEIDQLIVSNITNSIVHKIDYSSDEDLPF